MPVTPHEPGPIAGSSSGPWRLLIVGRRRPPKRCSTAMLQRWPDDAYGLASRPTCAPRTAAIAPAIDDAERLVAAHPDRSAADWFNLAFLRDRDRRSRLAAEAAFRRALALDPKLDRAWYGLGLSLIRLAASTKPPLHFEAQHRAATDEPVTAGTSSPGFTSIASEPEKARRIIAHLKGSSRRWRRSWSGKPGWHEPQATTDSRWAPPRAMTGSRPVDRLQAPGRFPDVVEEVGSNRHAADGKASRVLAQEAEDHRDPAGDLVRRDLRGRLFRPRPDTSTSSAGRSASGSAPRAR